MKSCLNQQENIWANALLVNSLCLLTAEENGHKVSIQYSSLQKYTPRTSQKSPARVTIKQPTILLNFLFS